VVLVEVDTKWRWRRHWLGWRLELGGGGLEEIDLVLLAIEQLIGWV
jgi:hypothetical protein